MTSLNQDFADALFALFVKPQTQLNAYFLQHCTVKYTAERGALILECKDEQLFNILLGRAHKLVFPESLAVVEILMSVVTSGGDINLRKITNFW